MVLMEEDREIVTKERWEVETPRSIPGLLVGAIARTAIVVAQRVSSAVALRRSEPAEQDAEIRPRMPRPLPNTYLASFIAVVVIPSFLCFVYLAFIASDQYVAEARFAVQSAQFGFGSGTAAGGLGALSSGSIPSMAGQDAYIITNYIQSRAIIDDLAGKIDIRAIFQRPEADFWARLKNNPSAEELTDYWKKMVTTYIDGPSGIVTLTIRAFRPADAEMLAQAVIEASEKLANDVSARARTTIMRQAEDEVRRTEGLVRTALADMRDFRDRQGFIDPVSAATSTSTLLLQAMAQKIGLENNYFVASKAMSPDAPTVVELKTQIDGLDGQIAQLKSELTGNSPEGRTIAASLVTFEELELKRVFAEKLYTMAQDALERARLRAEQQNIFVSTFVPPSVPQDAKYPQRLSLSLLIPIGLSILWGIFALIGAAIEDHRY
jgi:capsular polysaccharide transport system permease protein